MSTLSSRAADGTACTAHTRAYRAGVLVAEGFSVLEVSERLTAPDAVVWLDLLRPGAEDLAVLVDELGLHPLAVEDALHAGQRAKVDIYEDHLFLALYGLEVGDNAEVALHEVNAFVTARALVTVRSSEGLDLAQLQSRWDAPSPLSDAGVAHLLHGLLDLVVDGHFHAVEVLDDELDALEEVLFDPQPRPRELQLRTFTARKSLAQVRRVVLPMREVVNVVMRRDLKVVDARSQPYFQDVYDHVLRVTEWTESLRDLVSTVLETNLTLQGNRLNVVMRNLTAWAAILAVTTSITGFYGQNVPYPGFGERSGFVSSVLLLVGATTGLYLLLRRRGWL